MWSYILMVSSCQNWEGEAHNVDYSNSIYCYWPEIVVTP